MICDRCGKLYSGKTHRIELTNHFGEKHLSKTCSNTCANELRAHFMTLHEERKESCRNAIISVY